VPHADCTVISGSTQLLAWSCGLAQPPAWLIKTKAQLLQMGCTQVNALLFQGRHNHPHNADLHYQVGDAPSTLRYLRALQPSVSAPQLHRTLKSIRPKPTWLPIHSPLPAIVLPVAPPRTAPVDLACHKTLLKWGTLNPTYAPHTGFLVVG